jgi:hypothetical protein
MTMAFCGNCGSEMREGALFCTQCGADTSAFVAAVMPTPTPTPAPTPTPTPTPTYPAVQQPAAPDYDQYSANAAYQQDPYPYETPTYPSETPTYPYGASPASPAPYASQESPPTGQTSNSVSVSKPLILIGLGVGVFIICSIIQGFYGSSMFDNYWYPPYSGPEWLHSLIVDVSFGGGWIATLALIFAGIKAFFSSKK